MKQAVVLIHGIGEQKPMDTLRGFVKALLGAGEGGKDTYWSKPDPMSELLELRRLQAVGRPTTHFYEYYWAYNVEGTKIFDVLLWLVGLILRRGRDVPPSTKALWWLSRTLFASLVLSAFLGAFSRVQVWFQAQPVLSVAWIAIVGLGLLLQLLVVSYLGDAARYMSPRPANIRLRHAIRSEGVQLLRTLHKRGEYDRIIVVGHSLGSVIGYDILTHLWHLYNEQYPGLSRPEIQTNVRECLERRVSVQPIIRDSLSPAGEALAAGTEDGLKEFQDLQREGWREQRSLGNAWRVSDFVTLGSPLTHAMLLLARDREDFESRKRQRELPTCPPQRDAKGYGYSGPTPVDIGEGKKFTPLTLHHAAAFAVTRWTNLYVPARLGLFGDIVGGPLRASFGPGIRDVAVRTSAFRGLATVTPLSHNWYWFGPDAMVAASPAPALPLSLPELKNTLALSFLRKFSPREWSQLGSKDAPDSSPDGDAEPDGRPE